MRKKPKICPLCKHPDAGKHEPTCPLQPIAALARSTDPETSHAAAAACSVTELEATVYQCVVAAGQRGVTAQEAVDRTGIPWNTCSNRFRPLADLGLIEDSGLRRPGLYRRDQIVWRAPIRYLTPDLFA